LADGVQQASRFGAGRRVARSFVLEIERYALLARPDRSLADTIVDRRAIRLLIVEPPEVEDTDVRRVERLRELARAFDQLVLLRRREVGAELRRRRAVARLRRTGPVGLENRRRDLGHAELEPLEHLARLGHLSSVPRHDVPVVHRAQLDVTEAELARGDLAGVPEVLRDLVSENREFDGSHVGPSQTIETIDRKRRAERRRAKPGDELPTRAHDACLLIANS